MIPAEAVEAAAKAWCGTIDLAGWQRRHIIKLLEAATPHIQAYLLAELRKVVPPISHGIDADARFANGYNEALRRVRAAVAAAKETE